jgi:hypothetical protein
MRYEGIMEKPGMKFFGAFEKQLPENVDAMLLSAVGESDFRLASEMEKERADLVHFRSWRRLRVRRSLLF